MVTVHICTEKLASRVGEKHYSRFVESANSVLSREAPNVTGTDELLPREARRFLLRESRNLLRGNLTAFSTRGFVNRLLKPRLTPYRNRRFRETGIPDGPRKGRN